MNTNCKEIQYVLDLVTIDGNSIKEVQRGWSEIDHVIVMNKRLNPAIKTNVIATHPKLKYWKYDGSPMDPPDEGFVCEKCSVSISFPQDKLMYQQRKQGWSVKPNDAALRKKLEEFALLMNTRISFPLHPGYL